MGPGTWVGAKKAIEDAPGNVIYATKTRTSPHEKKMKSTETYSLKILVLVVVLVAIFLRYIQS